MRSLFLPLPLILAPLAAALPLTSSAKAQVIGPCCIREGETRPPDPERPRTPPLISAKVRSPDERALEATAEAPVPAGAPLVETVGELLNELPELPKPTRQRVPIIADEDSGPIPGVDDHGSGLISLPGCCQTEGETHPPDPHEEEEEPPIPVMAAVKNREQERLLSMAAEAEIERARQLIKAIGIPLYPVEEDRRGVSEPEQAPALVSTKPTFDSMPDCCTATRDREPPPVAVDSPWGWLRSMQENVELILLVLLLVLAIGFSVRWRRSRAIELEDQPTQPRPLPDELPRPDAAPVPVFEPEVALAKVRAEAREAESA